MREFSVLGEGEYLHGRIQVIVKLDEQGSDVSWVFYQRNSESSIQCLRSDIFNVLYIKSGCRSVATQLRCFGVYESRKRLRVVPFVSAKSPRGEETIIAYRELITGRDYAMPLKVFLSEFELDYPYSGQEALVVEQMNEK